MMVPDTALRIDEIERRPILVLEGAPDRVVVVDRDRVIDAHVFDGPARWAVKDMRVDYPVAVDNDHTIWRAFKNQYWPALYFVDAQGRVRHHHFGEGGYEQSAMIIQELLAEAVATGIDREPVPVSGPGLEAAADLRSLKSGEDYVGY